MARGFLYVQIALPYPEDPDLESIGPAICRGSQTLSFIHWPNDSR